MNKQNLKVHDVIEAKKVGFVFGGATLSESLETRTYKHPEKGEYFCEVDLATSGKPGWMEQEDTEYKANNVEIPSNSKKAKRGA